VLPRESRDGAQSAIQLLLGHGDLKTTQRYLNVADEELRNSMREQLWTAAPNYDFVEAPDAVIVDGRCARRVVRCPTTYNAGCDFASTLAAVVVGHARDQVYAVRLPTCKPGRVPGATLGICARHDN
jgi:hypothetical protein